MRLRRIAALVAMLLVAWGAAACVGLPKPEPRHQAEVVANTFMERYAAQDIPALGELLANDVVLTYRNGDFEILPKQAYLDELSYRKAAYTLHNVEYEVEHITYTPAGVTIDLHYTAIECDMGATDGSWEGDCFDVVGDGRLTLLPWDREWRVTIIYFDTDVLYDGE